MALVFTPMGSLILCILGKDKYVNGSSTATSVSFVRTVGKLGPQRYLKEYRDFHHHPELGNLPRMRELFTPQKGVYHQHYENNST